jgi:hypothetical protein
VVRFTPLLKHEKRLYPDNYSGITHTSNRLAFIIRTMATVNEVHCVARRKVIKRKFGGVYFNSAVLK